MWEFPVDVMDSWEFYQGKSWQREGIERIIERTKGKIDKCMEGGKEYLNLLFHDRYFCGAYGGYRRWYEEMVGYLRSLDCTFIDYPTAIRELNRENIS